MKIMSQKITFVIKSSKLLETLHHVCRKGRRANANKSRQGMKTYRNKRGNQLTLPKMRDESTINQVIAHSPSTISTPNKHFLLLSSPSPKQRAREKRHLSVASFPAVITV